MNFIISDGYPIIKKALLTAILLLVVGLYLHATFFIFLSIFNAHVQRAPIQGIIANVVYNKGKFLPAMHRKAHVENESMSLDFIQHDGRKIRCMQIAGIIARRIVLWKKSDDGIQQGEVYGMIKFGSQVDISIPYDAEICVWPKQKVHAGTTILAQWR